MALESLHAMESVLEIDHEIVVVDNNSNDNTSDCVEYFASKGKRPIRYVLETRQGLGYARNCGVAEARGDVIAFIDDDCIVDGRWLKEIYSEFCSNPSADILGGSVLLWDDKDIPLTTSTAHWRMTGYRCCRWIHGCNMVYSREVFATVGAFEPNFGVGGPFLAAEDTDFLYRAFKAGFKVAYSPMLLVYHNHGRRTQEAIDRCKDSYNFGKGAFFLKHVAAGDVYALILACRELFFLAREFVGKAIHGRSVRVEKRKFLALLGGMRCAARLYPKKRNQADDCRGAHHRPLSGAEAFPPSAPKRQNIYV
jgi:glycosyltransferase involved in cell wall biosynthesis